MDLVAFFVEKQNKKRERCSFTLVSKDTKSVHLICMMNNFNK